MNAPFAYGRIATDKNFIGREVETTITLKKEEKVALFLRNRCALYICGEINDSFIENIIGGRQEILENRQLNNSIQFVLKNTISFLNPIQREMMRNEWSGKKCKN